MALSIILSHTSDRITESPIVCVVKQRPVPAQDAHDHELVLELGKPTEGSAATITFSEHISAPGRRVRPPPRPILAARKMPPGNDTAKNLVQRRNRLAESFSECGTFRHLTARFNSASPLESMIIFVVALCRAKA
uniref:Uncharacterized protein n=1 Tax=Anopheles albimanus TaxID=7167 RepID=A0A182F8T0_ANOAL